MPRSIVIAVAALALSGATEPALSPQDEAAAFDAAGFSRSGGAWRACDAPEGAASSPGAVELVADLNGDGRVEAILSEGGTFCYGAAENGYFVVGQQADGSWRLLTSGNGIVRPLATKGAGGWPDLEIGGPGFCFAVDRWNGRTYEFNRFEYDGQRCNP
jgi:hypothetical protein